MVFPEGTADEEAMKYSENAIREDVKAADEAEYFNELLTQRCGEDVDKLAAMVGRSREFCEGRLLLLRGDPEVFAALQSGDISLGVAEWLNRCKDATNRRVFLDSAVKSGATVNAMRQWVQQSNQFTELQETGPHGPMPLTPPPGAAPVYEPRCHFCNEGMDVGPLMTIFAHHTCERIFLRRLQEQQEG
jgi:ParB-like chromosome segregation protein Spo0J